jgi:hypothetical protein
LWREGMRLSLLATQILKNKHFFVYDSLRLEYQTRHLLLLNLDPQKQYQERGVNPREF